MFSGIPQELDKIASNLEDKGLTKEAKQLDIISNTLEVLAANEEGGLGTRLLTQALEVLESGQSPINIFLEFRDSFLKKLNIHKSDINIKGLEEAFNKTIEKAVKRDLEEI